MRTFTFSTTAMVVITSASATLQANGPMATPSTTTNSPRPTNTNTGRTGRPTPMPSNYNGPGVTNCYDYAYTRGTGNCPSGRYLGPGELRNHPSVRSSSAYANPADARGQYRPND